MSLTRNDVMNTLYNTGFDHPGSRGNVDGQQETNERWFGSYQFDTRRVEISSGSRRWIGDHEIFTEDKLRPRRTLERPIDGRCRAGGLFNMIAFAGAGYVFRKLDKNGYEGEMKRHDMAMEKLSADKEKWYERTVEKNNKIALLQQKLQDAKKDLDDANNTLYSLGVALEDLQGHEAREPKLQDYYKPSDKMKRYMDILTGQ